MAALLRFLAGAFLLVAVVFGVHDATGARSGKAAAAISVHQTWAAVSPGSLKASQAAVQRYTHPAVWTWGILKPLQLPAWAGFGLAGLLFAYLGRRRRQVNIYAN